MITLKEKLFEALGSKSKYVIEYSINGSRNSIESSNYKTDLKNILSKNYNPEKDWYIVFDNRKYNFSEIDSVIEFGGVGSSFYGMMKRFESGEKSKIYTNLKQSEYDKLKSKYVK